MSLNGFVKKIDLIAQLNIIGNSKKVNEAITLKTNQRTANMHMKQEITILH